MKHKIVGEVRLEITPGTDELPQRLKVQIVEGVYSTNLGWWLKMKGLEGKRVKITVEENRDKWLKLKGSPGILKRISASFVSGLISGL